MIEVTAHRLIFIVPYEIAPEEIYEHKQLFTRAKLRIYRQVVYPTARRGWTHMV